jgi:hypothetical protein
MDGSETTRAILNPQGEGLDLFLSYNNADRKEVLALHERLKLRGIASFIDRVHLKSGVSWVDELEQALKLVRAVAVCCGPHGLGLWQKREMAFALDRQVREERKGGKFAVLPVLLNGVDFEAAPGFLFLNTFADLRTGADDDAGIERIVKAVRNDASPVSSPDLPALCPYRGLRPFREEDAMLFFGRDAFADTLEETVRHRNFAAVLAASGTGKSSVVQAGLLPDCAGAAHQIRHGTQLHLPLGTSHITGLRQR